MKTKSRRPIVKFLCLFLSSIMIFGLLQPLPVLAASGASHLERLWGQDRFQTMAQIALRFPGTVDNVVLATGNDFPDALAGVPLAHQKKGPLLLVDRTPELSQDALNYIKDHLNKKGNVYILGGTIVIPDSFVAALQNLGVQPGNIHRLAGVDRYETALAIAKELQHNGSEFYLVQGDNFPDALSASVLAADTGYVSEEKSVYLKTKGQTVAPAQGGVPLLLVPSRGPIPDSVIQYLNSIPDNTNTLKQVIHVIGGTAVIPEQSLQQLKAQVKRLDQEKLTRESGETRYGTMDKLNAQEGFFDDSWQDSGRGIPIPHIYLASGENFPDALTGAVLAANDQAPLVLVNNSLPQETQDLLLQYWKRNQQGSFRDTTVTALGGSGIISDTTLTTVGYMLSYGQSAKGKLEVNTLAGSGAYGFADGPSQEAEFAMPSGIAQGSDGTVYVADTENHRIRTLSKGQAATLAGVTQEKDSYGRPVGGYLDGPAAQARFNQPKGLAVGQDGTVYVADFGSGAIREIKSGQVSTLVKGLKSPTDIVIGTDGNLYVSETLNNAILKISPSGSSTVFAGGFNEPSGLAIDAKGYLYVADTGNQRIARISPQGEVTTLAGSGSTKIDNTGYIQGGYQDGPGNTAKFNFPEGIAVTPEGTVYIADTYNYRIREISPLGEVRTLVGSSVHGKQNGFLEQVQFNGPSAIKITQDGNLLIADQFNNLIRLLTFNP